MFKKKKKFSINKLFLLALLIISFGVFTPMFTADFTINSAQAACNNDGTCDSGENMFNCKADCLPAGVPTKSVGDVIEDSTLWILGFATALCVLMIIIGGVYYIGSSGDEQKSELGKKIITYALIGLAVTGMSYALIVVVDMVIS